MLSDFITHTTRPALFGGEKMFDEYKEDVWLDDYFDESYSKWCSCEWWEDQFIFNGSFEENKTELSEIKQSLLTDYSKHLWDYLIMKDSWVWECDDIIQMDLNGFVWEIKDSYNDRDATAQWILK